MVASSVIQSFPVMRTKLVWIREYIRTLDSDETD
jgi:hypothetical protein